MLTVKFVSAFPLSSIIELGTIRDLGSMETPRHAYNWKALCKSVSQKVSSWLWGNCKGWILHWAQMKNIHIARKFNFNELKWDIYKKKTVQAYYIIFVFDLLNVLLSWPVNLHGYGFCFFFKCFIWGYNC
jgi:hypothetical protein